MSRRKGARRQARRNKHIALRAELCILLEDKLHPDYLKFNARNTQELLEHYKMFGDVPLKFGAHYVKFSKATSPLQWAQELAPLPQQVFDDKADAYARAMDATMLTGTGIVRLTPDQHSGTIMDMDSGNASGHAT